MRILINHKLKKRLQLFFFFFWNFEWFLWKWSWIRLLDSLSPENNMFFCFCGKSEAIGYWFWKVPRMVPQKTCSFTQLLALYPPYLNVELNIIFSPTSLTSDVRNMRSHHDKELRFTKLLFKILLFFNFWFDALHMRNSSIWLGDCFCILIVDIAPTGTRSQASTSTHEGSLILATEKF